MNEFLQNKQQVDVAQSYLKSNDWIEHPCPWKNWDLMHFLPMLRNGNILDMGACGSWVLENFRRKDFKGMAVGVDLVEVSNKIDGCDYFKEDLCKTHFGNHQFNIITCLSVLEHRVDIFKFIIECERLLTERGRLYITFDYNGIKQDSGVEDWQPLSHENVVDLIDAANDLGLGLTKDMDWSVQEYPLFGGWFYPEVKDIHYTFGVLEFVRLH